MTIFIVRVSLMVLACLSVFLGCTTSYAGLNEWTDLGPEGGFINTIAEDPFSPSTVLAGTSYGGIYKSTDGGVSWFPLNSILTATYIYVIVIDPLTPSTIFVGTWQQGLLKSSDGGITWSPKNAGLNSPFVMSFAIDPQNPATLYAGTANGVYRSANGGESWTVMSTGMPLSNNRISTIVIDPLTPSTIYAGTDGSGIYKSINSGLDWSPINTGITDTYMHSIAIHPTNPSILFAASNSGVFKSTDAGSSWAMLAVGSGWSLPMALAIDPVTPTTIYVATYYEGLYKSFDGGNNWIYAGSGMTGKMLTIRLSSLSSTILYAGMNGSGIFKSFDSGETWSAVNQGLVNTDVTAAAVDPVNRGTIYAASYNLGLMKSVDNGNSWFQLTNMPNLYINNIVIDPYDPLTIYVGASMNLWRSSDGGNTWDFISSGTTNPIVNSVAFDPIKHTTIYIATSKGIFKSTNNGLSWLRMNNGLVSLQCSDVVIDPLTPTTLYITTGAGPYKSVDGGTTWLPINSGLNGSNIYDLVMDPGTPSRLYAASYNDAVFISTDSGNTWSVSSNGLSNIHVMSLAVDPEGPAVYAGTDGGGVFKSLDYGLTWIPMNSGLEDGRINMLTVDPIDSALVFAGTRGRGLRWFQRPIPSTPSQLIAKAISSSRIVLTWKDNADDEQGFSLLRKAGRCGTPGQWSTIKSLPTDTTTFVDNHLSARTAYSYKIRAYNTEGATRLSLCTDAKTSFAGTPMAPTELTAIGVNPTQVSLHWKNNTDTDSTIEIFRKKADSPAELFRTGSGFLSSFIDMAADGNDALTEYSYFLRACNTAGCSPPTFQATIPFKPRHVKLVLSSGLINISWEDASDNETAFQIWRKDGTCDSTNNWSRIKTTTSNVTNVIDAVPAPGSYAYRLRSVAKSPAILYAAGYSVFTNCKNITVP